MPWNGDAARRRSRSELAKYGIEVPTHLPVLFDLNDLARLRPPDDVIARAVALYAVIAVREGAPVETTRTGLAASELRICVCGRSRNLPTGLMSSTALTGQRASSI
jgi:Domain of unknown function (DUF4272)